MSEPSEPQQSAPSPPADPESVGFGHLSTRPPGSGFTSPLPPSGPADYPFLAPPQAPAEMGRLGPYRVLGVLGRGGMGVVFRAEDSGLERQVALKVILPQFAGNADDRARFQREAKAQARVDHDHVAAIYQVGEDRGVLFLAMPLLKGRCLLDELRENPRPGLAEVLRIGRETAEGLAAAHEKGLVHRDVKPANLWIEGSRRRVKVLDFGLARTTSGTADGDPTLTRTGALLGTPAYMSLEQALGQKVDARTDIFSLGVILYEMTTGLRPYQGDSFGALAVALATETPPPAVIQNPAIPPEFSRLIDRLLASRPKDRPGSMSIVVDEIRRIEAGLPGSSADSGTDSVRPDAASHRWTAAQQDRLEPRRSRRLLMLGFLSLILAGAIGAILAWPPERTEVVKNTSVSIPLSRPIAPLPRLVEALPAPVTPPTPAVTTLTPMPPVTTPSQESPKPVTTPSQGTPSPIAVTLPPNVLPPRPKVEAKAKLSTPPKKGQAEFESGLKLFLGRDGPKDLDKAAGLFRSSAELAYPEGEFYAGWIFNHGLGKPAHFSLATHWYQQAAASGHPLARAVIALAQLDAWDLGEHVAVDLASGKATIKQVADEVKKLADAGDPVAKVIMAEMLAAGLGVAKDIAQAFADYESAARLGYAPAQNVLGMAYDTSFNRFNRKKDASAALGWYRQAGEQNDPSALFNLGETYRTGRLGHKDDQEAVKCYRKAIDGGSEDAMRALAKLYEEGKGLEKDEAEAAYWYGKAADNYQHDVDGGSFTAMQSLAEAFKNGQGRKKDEKEAEELFRKVAQWKQKKVDAGSLAALESVADDLMYGACGVKDEKQAFDLYRQAAERGSRRAMYGAGLAQWYGRTDVKKDRASAIQWFRKAADAGDADAMYYLGDAYAEGDGVERSSREAVRWYTAAAEAGNHSGYNGLFLMYRFGKGTDPNPAEAARWLIKYAEGGNGFALYHVGEIHELGVGVPRDQTQAIEWYRKAATAGSRDAAKALERLKAPSP